MTALGVSLLLIGAIVVMVEAHVPSMGALGGPGAIALGAGALLAVSGLGGSIVIAVIAAVVLVAAAGAIVAISMTKGMAVRRRLVRGGPEGVIGHLGVVQSWVESGGKVQVDGALWRARPSWGEDEQPELRTGDRIVVERMQGLTLGVRRAEEWEL